MTLCTFFVRYLCNHVFHKVFNIFVIKAFLLISSLACAEQLLVPHKVSYGVVVSHSIHQPPANYKRGTLLGAIAGGVIAHNDRGWGALGGAVIGAGLEHAIANGQEAHHVIVKLNRGDSFSIAMPENALQPGDCVAVKQIEDGADLTKVAYQFCEQDQLNADSEADRPSNSSSASSMAQEPSKDQQCEQARSKLATASDKHYNRVLADVQRLCQ